MNTIAISRTDNIGDVMLTLPMAAVLKKVFPETKICFIGKAYTKAIIECCSDIDIFIDRDIWLKNPSQYPLINAIVFVFPDREVAKKAFEINIATRIGTSHRWFHWLYLNELVHFSRKKSDLHESQLNLKLLKPLGIERDFSLDEITSLIHFNSKELIPDSIKELANKGKKLIILHPKSKGSAREWPLQNFKNLINLGQGSNHIFLITGTKDEGVRIRKEDSTFFDLEQTIDCTGKYSLSELISLISISNTLVACSTGPLHIASQLGIKTIGIYPPIKPMHSGRWKPIGNQVIVLSEDISCSDCRKTSPCHCIIDVTPRQVYQNL